MTTDTCTRLDQLRRLEFSLRERHTTLAKQASLLNQRVRCLRTEIAAMEKERLALEAKQFEEQGLITYEKPLSAEQIARQVDAFTPAEAAELLALLESELNQPAELPVEPEDLSPDEFEVETSETED